MSIHWVAKDLVVDTADLHVMVDLLMELFQLYVDTNLDDNEELNQKRLKDKINDKKTCFFQYQKIIIGNRRGDLITHLA
jgi:hypothetical protein